MTARHVYIVDDEEPIRRSIHLMLRVMGFAPRAFEHGAAFLDRAAGLDPGCVLLDIRMPQVDGLEVQRRLVAEGSRHSVVVMSGHGDLAVAVHAIASGAVAFLEKPFARQALEQALATGFAWLEDPEARERDLATAAQAVGALDADETNLLAMIGTGQNLEQIAIALGRPVAELDLARTRIFAKLQVHSISEALQIAFAAGLLAPGD